MRACRKYALVTVSSKVNASLSSSTTRGLTGCTGHLFDSIGRNRARLAHQFAQRADASAAYPAGTGLEGDVPDAAGAVGDGLDHVAVGDHGAVADVHGASQVPAGYGMPAGAPPSVGHKVSLA